MERSRIPLWILPLIFILTIWNPAMLALQASSMVSKDPIACAPLMA